ncbi:EAL domain-containing protein [Gorillibacterium sp. CAU 1737]|uniref:putative bifunctional diguanylate cyclase/phosphodiesterase n=1 Tax=Gorillibacterium sp. CAU 1737 TaxID=3140362 RepID=UPI003260F6AF
MNSLTFRRTRKLRSAALYVLLGAAALYGYTHPVSLMFGLEFSFAALFLFLTGRMYGLSWSLLQVLVLHAAGYFLYGPSIGLFLHAAECTFVILLCGRSHPRDFFWGDLLFWLALGLPFLTVSLWGTGFTEVLDYPLPYFVPLMGGLMNALVTELLVTYLTLSRGRIRLRRIPHGKIRFSRLLKQITLACIFASSFFYLLNNSRTLERSILDQVRKEAGTSIRMMETTMANWSKEDVRGIKLRSLLSYAQLGQMVRDTTLSSDYEWALLTQSGECLLSNPEGGPEWLRSGRWRKWNLPLYEWKPDRTFQRVGESDWKRNGFIYSAEGQSYTLYVKIPLVKFSPMARGMYMASMKSFLIVVLMLSLFAYLVHNFFLKTIGQLAASTENIPLRLKSRTKIEWPQSRIEEVYSLIGNFRSVTEKLSDMLQDSWQMAHYDALTGLPNRRHFTEHLRSRLKKGGGSDAHLAVLFIDLDRFKQINDTLGHGIGDDLLCQVAERLDNELGEEAFIARLGGDEFVVVMECHGERLPSDAADRLLEKLNHPFLVDGHELFVSASIGISLTTIREEWELDDLLKKADSAMYDAKGSGGNAYSFYALDQAKSISEQMKLEFELRKALDQGQMSLAYQPIYHSGSGQIVSVEALLRWNHPELGSIPPSKFIPVAESSGLIKTLGEWVIREACKQARVWASTSTAPFRVAVNLSPSQFRQGSVYRLVKQVLEETGLPPELLELEITEAVVVNHVGKVMEELKSLRQLGVQVWIDDFGTGYSSLGMLKTLPVDGFKIDQSFVRGIPEDSDNLSIVRTVLALAESGEWRVIAEGVETRTESEALTRLGCMEQQGFLFSQPLTPDQIAERYVLACAVSKEEEL